jgi:dTDP-4-amino-4,6-dideoxygalactose transaminase
MIFPRSAHNIGNISINPGFLNRHPAGVDRTRDVSATNPVYAGEVLLCSIKVADPQPVLQACQTDRAVCILVHYPIPLHLQRACEKLGYKRGYFPIAETITSKALSLSVELRNCYVQQDQVIAALFDSQT